MRFTAPKGMPQQAVDVLGHAATEILGEPDVKAKFKEIGFDALAAGPLDRRMRFEIESWAHVIADAGLEKQ
jgi:tripartite-type tricarboxylate transporter receptor subunit TctC